MSASRSARPASRRRALSSSARSSAARTSSTRSSASRSSARSSSAHGTSARKIASGKIAAGKISGRKSVAAAPPVKALKPVVRAVAQPPEQVPFRFCKPGWAVIVEKISTALGTRFVCPFCTVSHRVPGPVRGFRKMRRAQWIKLRRVAE